MPAVKRNRFEDSGSEDEGDYFAVAKPTMEDAHLDQQFALSVKYLEERAAARLRREEAAAAAILVSSQATTTSSHKMKGRRQQHQDDGDDHDLGAGMDFGVLDQEEEDGVPPAAAVTALPPPPLPNLPPVDVYLVKLSFFHRSSRTLQHVEFETQVREKRKILNRDDEGTFQGNEKAPEQESKVPTLRELLAKVFKPCDEEGEVLSVKRPFTTLQQCCFHHYFELQPGEEIVLLSSSSAFPTSSFSAPQQHSGSSQSNLLQFGKDHSPKLLQSSLKDLCTTRLADRYKKVMVVVDGDASSVPLGKESTTPSAFSVRQTLRRHQAQLWLGTQVAGISNHDIESENRSQEEETSLNGETDDASPVARMSKKEDFAVEASSPNTKNAGKRGRDEVGIGATTLSRITTSSRTGFNTCTYVLATMLDNGSCVPLALPAPGLDVEASLGIPLILQKFGVDNQTFSRSRSLKSITFFPGRLGQVRGAQEEGSRRGGTGRGHPRMEKSLPSFVVIRNQERTTKVGKAGGDEQTALQRLLLPSSSSLSTSAPHCQQHTTFVGILPRFNIGDEVRVLRPPLEMLEGGNSSHDTKGEATFLQQSHNPKFSGKVTGFDINDHGFLTYSITCSTYRRMQTGGSGGDDPTTGGVGGRLEEISMSNVSSFDLDLLN